MLGSKNTLARLVLSLLLALGLATTTAAQFIETFESPDATWKLANADCGIRGLSHKRTFELAHAGSSSEHIRFVAGQGTHVYYTLDLGRSPVIEETNLSLWLRADRARLQLLARVVLPRSLDERTGKPITALLVGDEYGEIGAWQQLQVKDVARLLARQTVVLRRQFGAHVDPREAYIDLLVLNTYGGPGETNVWIDDLEIQGVVDPEWARHAIPPGDENPSASNSTPTKTTATERPAKFKGDVLLVNNRPLLLRACEHQGETLTVLKALGFNAVALRTPATTEINEEARQLDLWLISPPPNLQGDPAAAARLDRVILWQLGHDLSGGQLEATRLLARELRAADATLRRPVVCGVTSDAWAYSREADVLLWNTPPLFTLDSLAATTTALRARAAQARVGSPYWANVDIGPSRAILEQLSLLDGGAPRSIAPDLQQARLAMIAALAGGARGLSFRSSAPLDADDEATQERASVLRLLNLELTLIEPWFAGGSAPQDLPTGDPALRATVLKSERSQLVLLVREPQAGQFVSPPPLNDTMLLALPGVPPAHRVYHLTADGLKQLEGPAGSTGAKIVVHEAGSAAIVAITQDPLVIQHLTRTSAAQRREGVESRLRLAANRLTSTALIVEEIRASLRAPSDHATILREAERHVQEADQLLARGDLTGCYRNTRRSEHLIAQSRRQWWDLVQSNFTSPVSSPCCVAFESLPSHVRLGFRLRQATWSKNGLPSGDCEELDRLIAAGWKHHRYDLPDVTAGVELSANVPHAGRHSLRLSAVAQQQRQVPFDTPAVSITTAPIQVRQGQIARVHGFVRVPEPLAGLGSGLYLYESGAGRELADVIVHAPAWREFTLYRAVRDDGALVVTLALHGIGEAYVDDVTVELISP